MSVRKRRGTDKQLFISTMLFYMSLYKNTLAPGFVWDKDRLGKGPVLIKTDSGTGRQAKSPSNIKFREDMHTLGFYIAPGLPNSTQFFQEMDDLYEVFKEMTTTTSHEIFTRKTYDQVVVVKERVEELAKRNVDVDPKSIKPAQLDNYDLPEIIDGKPGYDIKKRPWSYCFTAAKIFRGWLNIDFTPFTRRALKPRRFVTCFVIEGK